MQAGERSGNDSNRRTGSDGYGTHTCPSGAKANVCFFARGIYGSIHIPVFDR